MAELSTRYARALAELAVQSGALDECVEQAVFLREVLRDDEVKSVMEHPHILSADKRGLLSGVFPGGMDENLAGLLNLLIAKSREGMIVPILTAFIDEGNRLSGKTVAQVVSATQLSAGQLDRIRNVLEKKLEKQVEILSQTDPSLIGGFYIQVDGRLIDRTVKRQLGDLRERIIRRAPDDQQS